MSKDEAATNREQNNANHAPQVLSIAVPVIFLDCLPKSHNIPSDLVFWPYRRFDKPAVIIIANL